MSDPNDWKSETLQFSCVGLCRTASAGGLCGVSVCDRVTQAHLHRLQVSLREKLMPEATDHVAASHWLPHVPLEAKFYCLSHVPDEVLSPK